jgi:hypothetical protein
LADANAAELLKDGNLSIEGFPHTEFSVRLTENSLSPKIPLSDMIFAV